MSNHPQVFWAQRKDSIWVTIGLPDVKESQIELKEDKLVFKGVSEGKTYECELEFFKPVDANPEVCSLCLKP